MTRVWKDGLQVPVTLLAVVGQKIARYKTSEKDGYDAVVLDVVKSLSGSEKSGVAQCEFVVDDVFKERFAQGADLTAELLSDVSSVTIRSVSKGKGFQGAMKRFHLGGGPKTHGSKHHRQVGSLGNRKPRRVQKGHPHAGRMGGEMTTIKGREVVGVYVVDGQSCIAVRGSVPGGYNSSVSLLVG